MTIPDSYTQKTMIDAVSIRPNSHAFLGPEWFRDQGISTSGFWYDQKIGTITSIPPSAPGAPGIAVLRNRANQIQLQTAHYKTTDFVGALEAQDRRKFGTMSNLLPSDILMDLMEAHADVHDMTVHVAKAKSLFDGLIMGPPTSTGGAPVTMYDYYASGGLGSQYSLNMNLDSAGALANCQTIKREMTQRSRGVEVGNPIAYVGATLFDALRIHAEFVAGVERFRDGEYLRSAADMVVFGGIEWRLTENTYVDYLGNVTRFVPANEGRVVPAGMPAATKLVVSPAATIDEVGKTGRLKTPVQSIRADRSGWDFNMQSCFAAVVTRPDLVFKLTNT